jgi:CRP-like cAMP-binding protein
MKSFYPLNSFNDEELKLIIKHTRLNHVQNREMLFREGSNDPDVIYLVQGSIKLTADSGESFVLEADSEQAHYPIANLKPRRFSARVESEHAAIARVPSSVLEPFMSHPGKTTQISNNSITDDSELKIFDSDWMMAMVKTPLFAKLPPAHIQKLFNVMEEVRFKAGETVIGQGETGDYFYLIKKGQCLVSRNNGTKEIPLAEMGPTESFGEEALLANTPRNATVRMLTNGRLMRISKEDFQCFLRDQVIQWIDAGQATSILAKGAVKVDLTQSQGNTDQLKDAIKIQPFMLRNQMKKLSRKNTYLLLCDNDEECAVASYLLTLRGLNSYVLRGGISNLPAGH